VAGETPRASRNRETGVESSLALEQAAEGASFGRPVQRRQWWQEIIRSKPLMENPSSHVSLADIHPMRSVELRD